MEVGKINFQNEDKAAVLKQAVENGGAQKRTTNLFNALNFENTNPISENDFAAFNLFKDKNNKLSLSDEKLKALKLFDIDNDGSFSDSEFELLKETHYTGGESLLLNANLVDLDEDGKFNKKEANMKLNIFPGMSLIFFINFYINFRIMKNIFLLGSNMMKFLKHL